MIRFLAAALLLASPAMSQTLWTVEPVINNVPGKAKVEATTPAAARTTALRACGAFDNATALACVAKVGERSFTSLGASTANFAVFYVDLEMNEVGGRKTYVVITAQRQP